MISMCVYNSNFCLQCAKILMTHSSDKLQCIIQVFSRTFVISYEYSDYSELSY